jgi:uncharacterized protein
LKPKYYFFDTSAVIKYYCVEVGSKWVDTVVNPANGNIIYLAEITMAEFGSAIAIKQRVGNIILAYQQKALGLFVTDCTIHYTLSPVTSAHVRQALNLTQKHILRGYDAVQLATALSLKLELQNIGITDFTFVTADTNLVAAAPAEGLTVENPNNHP